MTEPGPTSATTIEADPTAALPWDLVRDVLKDARTYWSATVHPSGRPHVRPVLAVWVGGALYSTSTEQARKGRNLAADPRCTVTASIDSMDVILEGTATQVTDGDTLHRVAEEYRGKYDWPVTVTGGAFDAPYGAPTAGSPPYHLYRVTPATIFGFGTANEYAGRATRYRF
jgi:nitroimidazol reductase NimA-like FMN-containing flavoprotein (pyridoxamine 5'-phosphate oxidase superfamily)